MFGVVLWSSQEDRTAVVWCEDHGDLAMLNQSGQPDDSIPASGDLIQFDVAVEAGVRRASNAIVVEPGHFRGLPAAVRAAAPDVRVPATRDQKGGQVVAFRHFGQRRFRLQEEERRSLTAAAL